VRHKIKNKQQTNQVNSCGLYIIYYIEYAWTYRLREVFRTFMSNYVEDMNNTERIFMHLLMWKKIKHFI
jgi:hypothetical protein